jgi:hypothetical protein
MRPNHTRPSSKSQTLRSGRAPSRFAQVEADAAMSPGDRGGGGPGIGESGDVDFGESPAVQDVHRRMIITTCQSK